MNPTVKEFIADKRATEAAEAAPISSNFASYEVGSPDMVECLIETLQKSF